MGELKKEIEGIEYGLSGDLWSTDPERAKKLSIEFENKKRLLKKWSDLYEYNLLISEDKKIEDLTPEDRSSMEEIVNEMEQILNTEENKKFFSGKYDKNNAFLSIKAGAGGNDAEDFCKILLRMYLRYAEIKGWQTNIINESQGEGGIRDITLEITGDTVYGHLKRETGTHRLVRLSPFKSNDSRQTSFALVEVVPIILNTENIKIDEKDLRIDTFRSSGAGGQKVNKTESAVRITHIPTGIAVACQNERSQHQNKERAMNILISKLELIEEKKREEEENKLSGVNKSANFGSQIRNYVMHPYTLVKDLRSEYEEKDIDKIFDGHIDPIIESLLKI